MLNAITSSIRYPGIAQAKRVTIVRSHGIVPDAIMLHYQPQQGVPAEKGTLAVRYGDRTLFLPDCRADVANIRRGEDGRTSVVTLLDGRWKWRWGSISGDYNIRRPDGTILGRTNRSPQQLASLCLRQMKVQDYDVSRLPNTDRPRVQWDAATPARALEQLCLDYGCAVVYRVNFGSRRPQVVIWPLGLGDQLPLGPHVQDVSNTLDPKEPPDAIRALGGYVRYETVFFLQPVGKDRDGSYRPVEALSYKPDNVITIGNRSVRRGWLQGASGIAGLRGLDGELITAADESLATGSVFRDYRIQVARTFLCDPRNSHPDLDPWSRHRVNWRLTLPVYSGDDDPAGNPPAQTVRSLWQILPVESGLANFEWVDPDNPRGKKPNPNSASADFMQLLPYAFGIFGGDNKENNFGPVNFPNKPGQVNPARFDEVSSRVPDSKGLRIDRERGLVHFNQPIYRWGTPRYDAAKVAGQAALFPILLLRTTCPLRAFQKGNMIRYWRERQIARNGTGPRLVVRPEAVLNSVSYFDYGDTSGARVGWRFSVTPRQDDPHTKAKEFPLVHNKRGIDPLLDRAIDETLREYRTTAPQVIRYRGMQPIDLDGAIRQVVWTVGDLPSSTVASRNDEAVPFDYKYNEKAIFGLLFEWVERRKEGQRWARVDADNTQRGHH